MERNPYDTATNGMQQPYIDRSQEMAHPSNRSSELQVPAGRQQEYIYPAYTLPTRQAAPQASSQVAPTKQARKPNMPKQKALALVSLLKKGIIVSSVVSFGFFGLLSANHIVNTTTSNSTSTTKSSDASSSTKSTGSSSTTKSSSSSSSTQSSSGSSLKQQNGGYSFGSSSSSAQGSVSSTGVS